MTDAEIAWAAGLIEGEGCFFLWTQRQDDGVGRTYRYPRLQVNSTDEDVLLRLQVVLGGTLGGPYVKATPTRPNLKAQWQWSVNNPAELDRIASLIRPWLCQRRGAKLDEVLAATRGRIRP